MRIIFFVITCLISSFSFSGAFSNEGFEDVGVCVGVWYKVCPSGYAPYQPDYSKVDLEARLEEENNVVRATIHESSNLYTRAGFSRTLINSVAGKTYIFSILIKPEGFRGQTRLQIIERDSQGNPTTYEVDGPVGTGSWQKVTIVRTIASSASSAQFNVMTSTNGALCPSGGCGSVSYDNFSVEEVSSSQYASGIVNPCSDGFFLDPGNRVCLQLNKIFGFSYAQFEESKKLLSINLNSSAGVCYQQDFINAINQLRINNGGTLLLPACTLNLNTSVFVPNNTVIQGAGTGRTIIRIDSWGSTSVGLLRIERNGVFSRPEVSNVIFRDFSLRSVVLPSQTVGFVNISDSENVLLERLDLDGASRSNLNIVSSQKITVRYVNSRNAYWHAIGTKDCFPWAGMDSNFDGKISKNECSTNDVRFWTDSLSLYSNMVNDSSMGIDSHSSNAEVGGNIISGNVDGGAKFPEPANYLWVHDNIVRNNGGFGLNPKTQYTNTNESPHVDFTMKTKNHIYYRNNITDNGFFGGQYGFRVDKAEKIVLVDNKYSNNAINQLRINDDSYDSPVFRAAYFIVRVTKLDPFRFQVMQAGLQRWGKPILCVTRLTIFRSHLMHLINL